MFEVQFPQDETCPVCRAPYTRVTGLKKNPMYQSADVLYVKYMCGAELRGHFDGAAYVEAFETGCPEATRVALELRKKETDNEFHYYKDKETSRSGGQ